MPSDRPKPWERQRGSGRTTQVLERRRVLIVCEDEKSSCLYFDAFPLDKRRVEVTCDGTGRNTDSLVEHAIEMKRHAVTAKRPYSRIWCVFDRDSFPPRNFNRALELANHAGIDVAWSNEAFELWYLLHFNYHDTGMSRTEYGPRLGKLLGEPYDKADAGMYAKLEEHQPRALKHARRLEKHWVELGGCDPEKANPSTGVHKLVEFLNEFKDLGPADE